MRKNIFFLGAILLSLAVVLFCFSYQIMQSLYRASPTEWAVEDTPEHRNAYSLAGACFFASIVLGIIGIITVVYGAGPERKSQETKQVLNNESAEC
jgi:ABC-type sulfate transport system permease component